MDPADDIKRDFNQLQPKSEMLKRRQAVRNKLGLIQNIILPKFCF